MPRRLVSSLAGALVLVAAAAAPASAHVTVNPGTAAQGGYAKLTFRVPNERPNASTTKIEVQLPADKPITSVSVQPTPGWTYALTKATVPSTATSTTAGAPATVEVVSTITWTGSSIKPGEFQEFSISAGPLPKDVTSLTFKAVQTYDSGEVVRWIEERQAGQPEPKNPAPVLTLTAASTDGGADTHGATSGDAAAVGTSHDGGSDGTARTLGVVGIVVGALGLAAGALGLTRNRRQAGA